MTNGVMLRAELPGMKLFSRGKVRDVYDLGDALLFIASDRISAFDVVMAEGIPGKGKILTALTMFWLERLGVRHHVITDRVAEMPPEIRRWEPELEGRSMLVKKLAILPVECVVRGYLAGSGLKSYRARGEVCGVALPPGLREADRLPDPIFTPTTKAASGHDEEMTFDDMASIVGEVRARELRDRSIEIYLQASEIARARGVILCDTKFEWGADGGDGSLILADEVLTPDSSRFWPGDRYAPGAPQPSFDKQFLRDWLERSGWDKRPPPPHLPPDVIEGTASRYAEIYGRLIGKQFQG